MVCHYWVFNYGSSFCFCVCNSCHDLMMLGFNISDIITVEGADYHCIIHGISKYDAIHLLENS